MPVTDRCCVRKCRYPFAGPHVGVWFRGMRYCAKHGRDAATREIHVKWGERKTDGQFAKELVTYIEPILTVAGGTSNVRAVGKVAEY